MCPPRVSPFPPDTGQPIFLGLMTADDLDQVLAFGPTAYVLIEAAEDHEAGRITWHEMNTRCGIDVEKPG
jgi:hypothetical protein